MADILIVDDSVSARVLLGKLFGKYGHNIVLAEDFDKASKAIQKQHEEQKRPFDVVVNDRLYPGTRDNMSGGDELLDHLLANPQRRPKHLIMASGSDDLARHVQPWREQGLKLSVYQKPVNSEVVKLGKLLQPHLLLVEDEPDHRMSCEDRLQAMKIPYVMSEDFSGARAILDSGQKISMVLSDGRYPGDSDFPNTGSMSLLRHMHVKGVIERTPVLIMTDSPDLVRSEMKRFAGMPEMAGFKEPEIIIKDKMSVVFSAVARKLGVSDAVPTTPVVLAPYAVGTTYRPG